jgi:integrase
MGLTSRIIEAAKYKKAGNARYVLWDDDPVGLGLRVFPSGRKTFVLSYRTLGRKRLMALGDAGVLNLEAARRRARAELLAVETKHADPLAEKQGREVEARTGSVEGMLREHVASIACKRPDAILWYAEKFIFPRFGTRPWRSVRRSEIRAWHTSIRSPYNANRSLQALRAAYYWRLWQEDDAAGTAADASKRDTRNPCAGIPLRTERRRQTRLEIAQVPQLDKAIEDCVADRHARAFFRFLVGMGCRKTEALLLRWEDVNIGAQASSVTFRDTKNGEDRVVPLPASIAAELDALPRVDGNPFMFVGRKPGRPLTAVNKAWERVRKHAALPHLRLHDLRRSFGSWLGDAGFTSKQIGTVLGHKTDITSRVYMALGHESKRAAVEAVQTILNLARQQGTASGSVTMLSRQYRRTVART